MRYLIILLTTLYLIPGFAQQFQPAEAAVLNYTQVLFETEEVPGAERYLFQLTQVEDMLMTEWQQWDSTHVTIINHLKFGGIYRWKVQAYNSEGTMIHETEERHFSIGRILSVDPETYRFRIINHGAHEVLPGVIFLDKNGVAINRKGEPVWYLPPIERGLREDRLRDLKMTGNGTLTFLTLRKCVEINIDGSRVWTTPANSSVSHDSTEFYHHEFTKLPNGNFIVLGKSYEMKSLQLDDLSIDKIPVSVVIEYNPQGDTVWTWSSRTYVQDDDLLKVGKKVFYGNTFGHSNSLAVSEDNQQIYVGFRDLNAVLVVDRNTRKVLRSYGDKIPSDTTKAAIGFFRKQHAATPLGDGNILVFNNDDRGRASSVVVFSETGPGKEPSKIVWEFSCAFDSLMSAASDRMGNAQNLPDGHFLVNMGNVARLFEVTQEKEVVWDCLPETWNSDSGKWTPLSNYRLNFQSSLFPKYFSTSLRKDDKGTYLLVTNEGSDADGFSVNWEVNGKPLKKEEGLHFQLAPGTSKRIYVAQFLSGKQLRKNAQALIHSDSNPQEIRKRSIPAE